MNIFEFEFNESKGSIIAKHDKLFLLTNVSSTGTLLISSCEEEVIKKFISSNESRCIFSEDYRYYPKMKDYLLVFEVLPGESPFELDYSMF